MDGSNYKKKIEKLKKTVNGLMEKIILWGLKTTQPLRGDDRVCAD